MAALALQNIGNGGAITTAAAAGGGDTIPGGPTAGGWGDGQTCLVVVVGATATVVTVDGVALPSATSQTLLVPVRRGTGAPVSITYSQVASVTVAAVRMGPPLTGITFGT